MLAPHTRVLILVLLAVCVLLAVRFNRKQNARDTLGGRISGPKIELAKFRVVGGIVSERIAAGGLLGAGAGLIVAIALGVLMSDRNLSAYELSFILACPAVPGGAVVGAFLPLVFRHLRRGHRRNKRRWRPRLRPARAPAWESSWGRALRG